MSRTRRDLGTPDQGRRGPAHGYVMVDGAGRIRRETASAEQWLTRYFGSWTSLPSGPAFARASLWDRVRSQGGKGRDGFAAKPFIRRPLVVEP